MRPHRLAIAVSAAVLLWGPNAAAQSLTGTWQLTVTELSNTCAEPLGPPEVADLEILQAGNLVDIDVLGATTLTEVSGSVAGSSLSIGFENFDSGGLEIFDPAENVLSITGNGSMLSGDANWEFYEPLDCAGTQTWSAVKSSAGTPGDLSGNWVLTVVELSETCGPVDPTPIVVPITIVQEGGLVDVVAAADFGQTRVVGRVSGQTLNLGLGIREPEGDFSVFAGADNALAIQANFASFSGTMSWSSYEVLTCTGVNRWTAVLPEPSPGLAGLAGVGSLLGLSRWRVRATARKRSA